MDFQHNSRLIWNSFQPNRGSKKGITTASLIIALAVLYLLCTLPSHSMGIRWLGIYRLPKSADHPVESTAERFSMAECEKATNELGLRRRQMRFCAHPRFGYAMLAVLRAAHAVGYHCPKAFADRRWNCTSIHQLPEVSPELQRGTREQALVHAFASAALLFEIGRYCALNKIRFCSCGDDTGAYALPNYLTGTRIYDPSTYRESNNALMYESSGKENNMDSRVSQSSSINTSPIQRETSSTVSRFYWAGCSDNLRVAREYASAFLGFPNIRMLPLESVGTVIKTSTENNGMLSDRVIRSAFPLNDTGSKSNELFSGIGMLGRFKRIRRNSAHNWNQRTQPQDTKAFMLAKATPQNTQLRHRSFNSQHWTRRPRSRQKKKRASIIRVLNRHNYLAGVILMEANQRLVCKCHGVSGSCAQRVCFRQLRRIDNEIMQKALKMQYLAAKQVTQGGNGQLIAKTFSGNDFVDEVVKPDELVYSEHSPDYCNVEPQRGSVGTHGRLCTLNDSGTANCLNMCCGRGYTNITTNEVVQCNCRMGEGFKVRCDECNVEIVTHRCL